MKRETVPDRIWEQLGTPRRTRSRGPARGGPHTASAARALAKIPGVFVLGAHDGQESEGPVTTPRLLLALEDPWIAVVLGTTINRPDGPGVQLPWTIFPIDEQHAPALDGNALKRAEALLDEPSLWCLQPLPTQQSGWLETAHEDCKQLAGGLASCIQSRLESRFPFGVQQLFLFDSKSETESIRSVQDLLGTHDLVAALMNPKQMPEELRHGAFRLDQAAFKKEQLIGIEICLLEPQAIELRDGDRANLKPCRCTVPEFGFEARSLNHAYTLISQHLERKRISHTGNAFFKIWTRSRSDEAWQSLERKKRSLEQKLVQQTH